MIERRFEEDDQSGLIDLLKASYDGWHSVEYWRWKYLENPHGAPLIWVAEDKGEIVGCYILNPVKIRLGSVSILGAQSVDAAVDAAYRGAGIFKKLAIDALGQAKEEHIVITFAFPTEIAYKGQVRIGYRPMFILPRMYKILRPMRLLEEQQYGTNYFRKISAVLKLYERVSRHKVRVDPNLGLRVKKANSYDPRLEAFWKRFCKENTDILIERDRPYLRWRYFRNPEKSYITYVCEDGDELVGYCVLSVEEGSLQPSKPGSLVIGNIIDLVTVHGMSEVSFQLLLHSLDYFEREDVDIVRCWMSKRQSHYAALQKLGFSENYEIFRRLVFRPKYIEKLIIYVNSRTALTDALQSNLTHGQLFWFIAQGDADYT